jgi:hypothetical protein
MSTIQETIQETIAAIRAKWESAPISMRRVSALQASDMLSRWLAVEGQEQRKTEALTYARSYL